MAQGKSAERKPTPATSNGNGAFARLMPQEVRNQLRSLAETECLSGEELEVNIHFYHPLGGDWFVIGGDQKPDGDIEFYGFASLPWMSEGELGYFTLSMLESIRTPFGDVIFEMQREPNFKPLPFAKILELFG